MRFPALALVIVVANALTGSDVAGYFRTHLSQASDVFLPYQTNYTEKTTQRWNAFSAPTYTVSVKPASDRDVQKIVTLHLLRAYTSC